MSLFVRRTVFFATLVTAPKHITPNWCEGHILPVAVAVNVAFCIPTISRMRQLVVPQAHVLEVGLGTGLNMRHYDKILATRITALDP